MTPRRIAAAVVLALGAAALTWLWVTSSGGAGIEHGRADEALAAPADTGGSAATLAEPAVPNGSIAARAAAPREDPKGVRVTIDGSAVAGARVELWNDSAPVWGGVTDAHGLALLDDAVADQHELQVVVGHEGHVLTWIAPVWRPRDGRIFEAQLVRAQVAHFDVRRSDGRPFGTNDGTATGTHLRAEPRDEARGTLYGHAALSAATMRPSVERSLVLAGFAHAPLGPGLTWVGTWPEGGAVHRIVGVIGDVDTQYDEVEAVALPLAEGGALTRVVLAVNGDRGSEFGVVEVECVEPYEGALRDFVTLDLSVQRSREHGSVTTILVMRDDRSNGNDAPLTTRFDLEVGSYRGSLGGSSPLDEVEPRHIAFEIRAGATTVVQVELPPAAAVVLPPARDPRAPRSFVVFRTDAGSNHVRVERATVAGSAPRLGWLRPRGAALFVELCAADEPPRVFARAPSTVGAPATETSAPWTEANLAWLARGLTEPRDLRRGPLFDALAVQLTAGEVATLIELAVPPLAEER